MANFHEPSRRLPEKFLVAFSFAGEQRKFVRAVATAVERALGTSTVFFDEWFEYYLAGADSDFKLQEIYESRSSLAVVCVSERYGGKPWTMAEYEAVRARQIRARVSGDERDALGLLPIRVGDGDVKGLPFTTIVPDVRNRAPEAVATLILDRLALVLAEPSRSDKCEPTPQGDAVTLALVVERIASFRPNAERIRAALALYERRIPADERFDLESMVDLIHRHLANEFGPDWAMHFLIATWRDRCVGVLIGYEHISRNRVLIAYLAACNPRTAGKNPPNVSTKLVEGLLAARRNQTAARPRIIFEVESPDLTSDPRERRRRIGRLKLFEGLAPFEGLHLRILDIPYLQPRLQWPSEAPERRLLLCCAAPGLHAWLRKADALEILAWTYLELYGDDIFEDLEVRVAYRQHTTELLESIGKALPDQVRLLRSRDFDVARL